MKDLPTTGWKSLPISSFAKTSAGGTPKKSEKNFYEGGTIPWLLSGEVGQRDITEAKNFITNAGLKGSSAKIFPPKSILVAMYGATAGEVGILRFEAATNQAVCAILPGENHVPEYLYYFLLHVKRDLVSQAIGNAQPNISQAKIKAVNVPLPPLEEQRHIVAILDEAFEGLDRARENAELNLQNARELFERASTDLLVTETTNCPLVELVEVANLDRGQNPPKKDFVYEPREGYIRFYQIRDRKSDKFAVYVPDSEKLHRVAPHEILMSAYRHIGEVFRGADGAFNVALCKLSSRNEEQLLNDYLFAIIPTDFVKGELLRYSERSLIPSMSVKHLQRVKIPLPTVEKQRQIVDRLDALRSELEKLQWACEVALRDFDELRQSILQKAFAGELT